MLRKAKSLRSVQTMFCSACGSPFFTVTTVGGRRNTIICDVCAGIPLNGTSTLPHGKEGNEHSETRRSESFMELHSASYEESRPSSASKKKNLWNTFRRKFRSKSKDRGSKRSSESDGESSKFNLFDILFLDAEQRQKKAGKEKADSTVGEGRDSQSSSFTTREPHSPGFDGLERRGSEVDSGIISDQNGVKHQDSASQFEQRQNSIREHPFFQLEVILREGRDLVIRDSCGTSDPYVKFKIATKQVYRSRVVKKNLNPSWDEKFSLPIEDATKPLQVQVFDHDRAFTDDFMGEAEIDLTTLALNEPTDLTLDLHDKAAKEEYMGVIVIQCKLLPKTQDEKEQYFKRAGKMTDAASKKLKTQVWSSVVTVVLVEGIDMLPMDDNGLSDPYVKFKLGNEKYKSKTKKKKVPTASLR